MNTYYCVTSAYNHNGKVATEITDVVYLVSRRPEGKCKETSQGDIYTDWLTDREIREKHPELAKKYHF